MSNVFREVLLTRGVTSGSELAQEMEAPAVIFFFASPSMAQPHAELWTWDAKGDLKVSPHYPRYRNMTTAAMRKKTVAAAQEEAKERLGLEEWAKSPFDNCWLPQGVLENARARFMGSAQQG